MNELEELVLSSNRCVHDLRMDDFLGYRCLSTDLTPPTQTECRLEGVIPDELEQCEKLQTLDLQGNCLETGAYARIGWSA